MQDHMFTLCSLHWDGSNVFPIQSGLLHHTGGSRASGKATMGWEATVTVAWTITTRNWTTTDGTEEHRRKHSRGTGSGIIDEHVEVGDQVGTGLVGIGVEGRKGNRGGIEGGSGIGGCNHSDGRREQIKTTIEKVKTIDMQHQKSNNTLTIQFHKTFKHMGCFTVLHVC